MKRQYLLSYSKKGIRKKSKNKNKIKKEKDEGREYELFFLCLIQEEKFIFLKKHELVVN